ncbi:MAG: hypothetical protein LBC88_01460, partial [Spirochaetaceae bacterium]|jgi:hypothetical protein|nr:hypothetical protein [Spirochaetaceae bacterium]
VGVTVNGGTFTMKGGAISDNSAGNAGVRVHGSGTFTMKGGVIHGNGATAKEGGGVVVVGDGLFEMHGGRIQGGTDSGGFTGNNNNEKKAYSALWNVMSVCKWGTGGAYTIDGVPQTGGSEIAPLVSANNSQGGTSGTLIAIPAGRRVDN